VDLPEEQSSELIELPNENKLYSFAVSELLLLEEQFRINKDF
jgi:hypothetical protein